MAHTHARSLEGFAIVVAASALAAIVVLPLVDKVLRTVGLVK